MVSITGCTVSDNFSQNLRATFFCMFQFFQNYYTGAFSHNKSISFLIKRNGTTIRIRRCGKCCQCCKTADTYWCDTGLGSACYHNICIAKLNGTISLSDTMCTCCAGSYHIDALSFQPELNGYVTGCHIGDHHRNHKRIYTIWAFLQKFGMFFFYCLKTSDSGTNGTSHTIRIFLFHMEAGIFDCFFCSCYCILTKKFHSSCSFRIHIIFSYKSFDFSCHMCFVFRRIKFCNFSESMSSFFQS